MCLSFFCHVVHRRELFLFMYATFLHMHPNWYKPTYVIIQLSVHCDTAHVASLVVVLSLCGWWFGCNLYCCTVRAYTNSYTYTHSETNLLMTFSPVISPSSQLLTQPLSSLSERPVVKIVWCHTTMCIHLWHSKWCFAMR
jgi:hypothetical protein